MRLDLTSLSDLTGNFFKSSEIAAYGCSDPALSNRVRYRPNGDGKLSESKSPADNDAEGVDELAALREAHVRSAASAIDTLGRARDRLDDESKRAQQCEGAQKASRGNG